MDAAIDPRSLSPNKRGLYTKQALKTARRIATELPSGQATLKPFTELLKFVVESNYQGGCHDTSAVLHMLLAEAGVESTLCIGEVGKGRTFFDHSWVEVDGAVVDVAVCMPHAAGDVVGGPVFGGIDLISGAPSALLYGAQSGKGFDSEAMPALQLDLQGYSEIQPDPNIWMLVVSMASRCGDPNATFEAFQSKYGTVRRTLRT